MPELLVRLFHHAGGIMHQTPSQLLSKHAQPEFFTNLPTALRFKNAETSYFLISLLQEDCLRSRAQIPLGVLNLSKHIDLAAVDLRYLRRRNNHIRRHKHRPMVRQIQRDSEHAFSTVQPGRPNQRPRHLVHDDRQKPAVRDVLLAGHPTTELEKEIAAVRGGIMRGLRGRLSDEERLENAVVEGEGFVKEVVWMRRLIAAGFWFEDDMWMREYSVAFGMCAEVVEDLVGVHG